MHLFPILSSFTGGFQNFPNSDLHLFWKVPEIYRKQTHQGDGVLARWLAHSGGRKCHLKQTMRILEVWIVGLSVKNARFKTCRVIFQEDVRAEIPEVVFFSSGGIQWAKCGADKKLIMVPASISAKESWISIPCRVQRQCCLSLMLHLLLGAYVVLVCWLRSCSIPEPHIGFRTVIRTGHFNMSASALAGRDGGWMPLRRSSCGSHTIIQSSYRFHSWLQSGTPMQKTLLPNVTSQTSAKTKKTIKHM